MQVEIKIDESCSAPRVIILTDKMTDEINGLIKKITEPAFTPSVLMAFKGEQAFILDCNKVIRFYTANQKVYGVTGEGEYVMRLRLYELEERLSGQNFVRISHSEIISLKAVKGLDLSFAGTICVSYKHSAAVSYVSRRYVAKIKQMLGI